MTMDSITNSADILAEIQAVAAVVNRLTAAKLSKQAVSKLKKAGKKKKSLFSQQTPSSVRG